MCSWYISTITLTITSIDTHIILNKIHYLKDVDGFNDINIGKLTSKNNPIFYSCTACGCIEILDFYNINISGKITIVGCSNVVGLPLSLLLLHRNATPIICHAFNSKYYKFNQTS